MRHIKQNPRRFDYLEYIVQQLVQYTKDTNCFLHFSDYHTARIPVAWEGGKLPAGLLKLKYTYKTPLGIYVLRERNSAKYLFTSADIPDDYYEELILRLEEYVIEACHWGSIENTEKEVVALSKEAEHTAYIKTNIGRLWNVSRKLAFEDPKQWNYLLNSVLDIAGVIDDDCRGLIHRNEPCQAVFFSPTAFKVVEKFDNLFKKESYTARKEQRNLYDITYIVEQIIHFVQQKFPGEQDKSMDIVGRSYRWHYSNANQFDHKYWVVSNFIADIYRKIPIKLMNDKINVPLRYVYRVLYRGNKRDSYQSTLAQRLGKALFEDM